MKTSIAVLLVLLCAAGPQPTRPAWDGKTWQLGWAHGTAQQVADQINGDVLRLGRRCAEARSSIADERVRLGKLHDARLATLHATDAAGKIAQIADLTQRLNQARADHDSAAAIALSSQLNHDRQDLAGMETAAIAGDDSLNRSQALLRDQEVQLAALANSLSDARAWRGQMLDAMRNSFQLAWPLHKGDVGLLGPTKSTDPLRDLVRKTHGARVSAMIFDNTRLAYATEWREQTEEHESITTNKVVQHPFLVQPDGAMPEADTVVEIAVLDEDPPAATAIGQAVELAVIAPRPDHPFSQLMKAIDDGIK
ncbi:MAG TPA: hypothetical protein VK797_22735 [Tepidisphaeraceae bacterium]|jgi:hypothetical protein|nr:hypothetical protein [Tepidisphaeraceae bacterium]